MELAQYLLAESHKYSDKWNALDWAWLAYKAWKRGELEMSKGSSCLNTTPLHSLTSLQRT